VVVEGKVTGSESRKQFHISEVTEYLISLKMSSVRGGKATILKKRWLGGCGFLMNVDGEVISEVILFC
jgi:hypothetical protein